MPAAGSIRPLDVFVSEKKTRLVVFVDCNKTKVTFWRTRVDGIPWRDSLECACTKATVVVVVTCRCPHFSTFELVHFHSIP